MNNYQKFCCECVACGATTSKSYARKNGGKCKQCVTGIAPKPDQSLLCPDCREHYLTPYQKAHHYHCDWCTRQFDQATNYAEVRDQGGY